MLGIDDENDEMESVMAFDMEDLELLDVTVLLVVIGVEKVRLVPYTEDDEFTETTTRLLVEVELEVVKIELVPDVVVVDDDDDDEVISVTKRLRL